MRVIADYSAWPLKVEQIGIDDAGEICVKANGKWFNAAKVAESDKALQSTIKRHAQVEVIKRDACA